MQNLTSTIESYLEETIKIARALLQPDTSSQLRQMIELLDDLRKRKGRLFILGVGGSAANASHAVNDFRKIAGIESYAPTDNVSELTARVNDESWASVFSQWLLTSHLCANDALLIFSVGGGSATTSQNLVKAMELAKSQSAKIFSIVSRNGGAAKELSDVCILIPVFNEKHITPHAEGWQAILWHMIVSALVSPQEN